MSEITIARDIAAPAAVAWRLLADLATHSEWMKDAVSIEFATGQTSGRGTTMRVPTRVGPFRTQDVVEVTEWVDGSSIKVDHQGLVSGTGEFEVLETAFGSTIVWREQLRFPWWLGGAITAWLAAPVLRTIWKGNLNRFAAIIEGSTPAP